MKTNKVFKWLYGVFMFLPMLAIGVTCAYVTFNKNAKDSFSNSQMIQQESQVTLPSSVISGDILHYVYNQETITTTVSTPKVYFTALSFDPNDYGWNNNNWVSLVITCNVNQNYIYLFDNNNTYQARNIWGSDITSFTLEVSSVDNSQSFSLPNTKVYKQTYIPQKLDNAFYYAVGQFNDSGFNKVDFVSYFDMFYNNTSIWITFANTYMNYVLFVSLAFFIPRVLFWFINFAFSLVDGFSNKYKEW